MFQQIERKKMTTTQLSPADIRNQISKLDEVLIMVCDTVAFDTVSDAINQLKELHNEITKFGKYNVD